ncbi:MAG: histidine triad nucleotide-binding protein [Dehalococcoidia bacterium]|nr:histidine triad nucleotide-binding protein [Dehalococcoidia bacterium]MCB9490575.1 histidine triad nucleotide-binding protein [Dehalococcoidia bacterium]
MAYDADNIFAKILRDEIPSTRVYEDDEFIAFRDIAPSAPTHIIVIPRLRDGVAPTGPAGLADEDAAMVGRLVLTATRIAEEQGLASEGYRLVMNSGEAAGQTVFHLHLHILGGGRLGPVA